MCFDMIDPTPADFTEVEETYINAVADFLIAERDLVTAERNSQQAVTAQHTATEALREQFDNRVDAVTREVELVSEAVRRSVGEDSPAGEEAQRAATRMLQVEEAVANGANRVEAFVRVMVHNEDPRTPDPFKGVSLGGIL